MPSPSPFFPFSFFLSFSILLLSSLSLSLQTDTRTIVNLDLCKPFSGTFSTILIPVDIVQGWAARVVITDDCRFFVNPAYSSASRRRAGEGERERERGREGSRKEEGGADVEERGIYSSNCAPYSEKHVKNQFWCGVVTQESVRQTNRLYGPNFFVYSYEDGTAFDPSSSSSIAGRRSTCTIKGRHKIFCSLFLFTSSEYSAVLVRASDDVDNDLKEDIKKMDFHACLDLIQGPCR